MIDGLRDRLPPALAVTVLGLAAGAGLVPLLSLGEDAPPQVTTTTLAPPPSSAVTAVVEVTTPPVELEGVDPVVVRVLVESGYVSRVDQDSVDADLDPSVVAVLEEKGTVVTVFDGGGGG